MARRGCGEQRQQAIVSKNPDEFSSHGPSPTAQLALKAIDALEADAPPALLNDHVRAWQAHIGALGGKQGGHRWTSHEARKAVKAWHASRPLRTWRVLVSGPNGQQSHEVRARSRTAAIVAYARAHKLAKRVDCLARLAQAVGGWCEVVAVDGEEGK